MDKPQASCKKLLESRVLGELGMLWGLSQEQKLQAGTTALRRVCPAVCNTAQSKKGWIRGLPCSSHPFLGQLQSVAMALHSWHWGRRVTHPEIILPRAPHAPTFSVLPHTPHPDPWQMAVGFIFSLSLEEKNSEVAF